VQAVLLNITDRQTEYVENCHKRLRDKGFRVETDLRNEKIGFKIREHTLMRVPYLLVVGDREMEQGTVAVRTRKGEDLGSMPLEDFILRMHAEATERVN
jgi:threonyl-tRNA synthetase